jgi:hypothetical protein
MSRSRVSSPGWPSGMLVDAYEQCGEALQGDASVCSVLSASISSDAAGSCEAEGQVVAEVSRPRLVPSRCSHGALPSGLQY